MIEELKIYCKNTEEYIDIDGGDTLLDVYETMRTRLPRRPLCALVNNKVEDLRFQLFRPKVVQFLDITAPIGYNTYLRSLCMILYKAINDLHPGKRLRIEHSIAGGYYCRIKHEQSELTPEQIAAIKARMREIVDQDLTFRHRERLTQDVIEMFRQQGLNDKVRLLSTYNELYTTYYKLDNIIDSYYGPLVPTTGVINVFDLVPYKDGMLLLGPDRSHPDQVAKQVNMEKMFDAFKRYTYFNDIVQLDDVGTLNRAIREKKASIDYQKGIRCFGCQEFCPKGAMKVHRPLPARIINR